MGYSASELTLVLHIEEKATLKMLFESCLNIASMNGDIKNATQPVSILILPQSDYIKSWVSLKKVGVEDDGFSMVNTTMMFYLVLQGKSLIV